MAQGNEIIVSPTKRGVYVEGRINGTPKPGQVMQIKQAAKFNGRPELEVYTPGGDGQRPQGPLIVLLPDHLQGKTATDAYADEDWGFGYIPAAGEELNLLFKNISGTGTGDEVSIGEKLTLDDGSGKLIRSTGSSESPASPEIEPFVAMEDVTDVTADQLVHVVYSGY